MTDQMLSGVLQQLESDGIDLASYKGRRVLVTGGAGFIGSWLAEAFVRSGADVYVVDNLWRGSLRHFKRTDGTEWLDLASRFMLGDLMNPTVGREAMAWAKPDLVYHLADVVAGVDFVFSHEPFIFHANTLINTNVFAAAREVSVPALVYVGTACSYPRQLQQEPGGAALREEQVLPADPESAYGWSKLMGEYEAQLLGSDAGTSVGLLRLHNVYGPRASLSRRRSQVIPSLIRKAALHPEEEFVVWGPGTQARDFVYVSDVVEALLRLPLRGLSQGVIQIATASATTIADLAARIVSISGKQIQVRFDLEKPVGDPARSGDFQKAKRLLGWEPRTSLEDGLRESYAWAQHVIAADRAFLDE